MEGHNMANSIKELKDKLRTAALSAETAKKAKYRVKNEQGQYETIHLETSADQVITTADKQFVSAAEKTSYLDKYTQAQIDEKVREINSNISILEENDVTHLSKITELEEADKTIKSSVSAVDAKVDQTRRELEELINNGGGALEEYIESNDARVEALETGKADKVHTHEITDINGLRNELDTLETKSNVTSAIEAAKVEVNAYTDEKKEELVEAINEAKAELDGNKVNKSDISNTLNVTEEGKVLDARQGKVLKDLVDTKADATALESGLAGKADKSHRHSHTEIDGLGSAATKEVGNLEGQLVVVGAGNKIDASLLPSIAINETFVVNSEEEAMEQTVEVGDIVIVNKPAVVAKGKTKAVEAAAITYIVVNADADSFEDKFRPLVSNSDSITKGEVTEELAKKLDVIVYNADKQSLESSIATKANSADVYTKSDIDGKVSTINGEISRVESEFDSAVEGINESLAEKMDTVTATQELAKKANASEVTAELEKKADKVTIEAAVATKADKSYVDETMATKEEVNTELAKKADEVTVNSALAEKANKADVEASLKNKADATTVYTKEEVNQKVAENVTSVTAEEPVGKVMGHVWLELM